MLKGRVDLTCLDRRPGLSLGSQSASAKCCTTYLRVGSTTDQPSSSSSSTCTYRARCRHDTSPPFGLHGLASC
eukprot:4704303-Pleurochrysis_carterae.AAC.1